MVPKEWRESESDTSERDNKGGRGRSKHALHHEETAVVRPRRKGRVAVKFAVTMDLAQVIE